jgi:hypothetical protein
MHGNNEKEGIESQPRGAATRGGPSPAPPGTPHPCGAVPPRRLPATTGRPRPHRSRWRRTRRPRPPTRADRGRPPAAVLVSAAAPTRLRRNGGEPPRRRTRRGGRGGRRRPGGGGGARRWRRPLRGAKVLGRTAGVGLWSEGWKLGRGGRVWRTVRRALTLTDGADSVVAGERSRERQGGRSLPLSGTCRAFRRARARLCYGPVN